MRGVRGDSKKRHRGDGTRRGVKGDLGDKELQLSSDRQLLKCFMESPASKRMAVEIEAQKAAAEGKKADAIASLCGAVGQGVQIVAKSYGGAPAEGHESSKGPKDAYAYLTNTAKFIDGAEGMQKAQEILAQEGVDDAEELLVAPIVIRSELVALLKVAPGNIFAKVFECNKQRV